MNTIFNQVSNTQFTNSQNQNNRNTAQEEKSFQTLLDEKQEEKNDIKQEKSQEKENLQNLLDDVKFLVNTGLTKSEMEHITELIQKINEAIKQAAENGSSSYDIQSMVKNLQDMIDSIAKRVSGRYIKESDEDGTIKNESTNFQDKELTNLASKVEELKETFNNLKDGYQVNSIDTSNYRRTNWESELKKYQNMFT